MFKKTTSGGKNSPETSVPLDVIEEMIKATSEEVERQGNMLLFQGSTGQCRIEVESVHTQTVDGLEIGDIVSIRTELPEQMSSIDDRQIVIFNTMAALGALIRDSDSGRLSIVSRLSAFQGDNEAWNLYIPLIAFSALLQGDALFGAIRSTMGEESVKLGLPDQDGPSKWTEQDFEFAAERLNQIGMFSNAGNDGLTAEIPLEPGAVSAMMGDETSLLTFQAGMSHPAVGSGLFYKLELPIQFEQDELIFFANKLNQIEQESADAPPFFGAWCSQLDSGRLSHVGFWPNLLYQPGTVLNLAVWMLHRNSQARAFLENHRGG